MTSDPLRARLIDVARHLESVVVSLDRIGSTYATDRPKLESVIGSFVVDSGVFERLTHARALIFAILTNNQDGVQADEQLERELGDVQYWSPDEDTRKDR